MDGAAAASLRAVLERARILGFLGPGPVDEHIDHAAGFAAGWPARAPDRALDLGSGGGLPGLVLVFVWPATAMALLDAGQRRTRFLTEAVATLGVEDRVAVVRGRAEEVGRQPAHRGRYDAVVARSFAGPAVTAECAAPLLGPGGRLVVSEPPEPAGDRWPLAPLAQLGLRPGARVGGEHHYQVLDQVAPCPDRFPRRTGVPAKRPLF